MRKAASYIAAPLFVAAKRPVIETGSNRKRGRKTADAQCAPLRRKLQMEKEKQMTTEVRTIESAEEKRRICRVILEALPEWFGIPEAREEYVSESADKLFFAAMDGENPVGFLCLKETGRDTVELYVMGVLKARHRTGAGRALVEAAKRTAREAGYAFMQVKTVQMGKYAEYDATNRFYLAMGFREFEVFPHLWDEWNPCQVYVMGL